jgi:hypothetical protein
VKKNKVIEIIRSFVLCKFSKTMCLGNWRKNGGQLHTYKINYIGGGILGKFYGWLVYIFIPPLPEGGGRYTVLPLSVQDIFRCIFLSNCWWQKSDIWSQASYRCTILWVAFLDLSASYFLFADLVGFYTHLTYMHIFRHIIISNYWWQKSDIWSQSSYRYPISWEAFLDPSDSYFLFADLIFIHIEHICSFFVTFFSAPIDGRNLIFGHKLHIGTPYCGMCFLTCQIPTSSLPKSGVIIGEH